MMQALKNKVRNIFQREKTTAEQLKEVIETAEQFDALQRMAGWEKILLHFGTEVQGELLESTKYKYEPERQRVHVIRWDAKRELLDSAIGYIESLQGERDRILAEYKGERNNEHTSNASD